jgi:predicted NUDIX family NTP pyrophosphohydrolase
MRKSSGILLYRIKNKHPEFFLILPGGPFWKNKDDGAWSIPKGEFDEKEEPLTAAIREFK